MRVVAGTARGLRLVAPPGNEVRPTTDRVREATFNALGSLGVIEDARVVDLFAGSGAMGIEALSRGAAHCTFVDGSRTAVDTVRANLATTGFEGAATVLRSDALDALRSGRCEADVVVADPPYGFDGWADLLAGIESPLVVIESRRAVKPPEPWVVLRQRTYGATVVTIVERPDQTGGSGTGPRGE